MRFSGSHLAKQIYSDLTRKVTILKSKGITPTLAVILVGDDPASLLYIKQKQKWSERIGASLKLIHYPPESTTDTLVQEIHKLNHDPQVHGIIVQRPLPSHIDKQLLAHATLPEKDIDGFHPQTSFVIPVAAAVIRILQEMHTDLATNKPFLVWLKSQRIVVLGKGDTAGKPIIDHLHMLEITPEIIDSKTAHPEERIKHADIVISSVGKFQIIHPENIKLGVILIGVGITNDREEGTVGDYAEDAIAPLARFYTPTPGGVGPVNVAYLLSNLVEAAGNLSLRGTKQSL